MTVAESQTRDARRRQEAKEELERLNRRRAEREADMRLREEEEVRMQRLAESAAMAEWSYKEKLRAKFSKVGHRYGKYRGIERCTKTEAA